MPSAKPLFVRNSRPLTLTPEARVLQQHLRKISGEFSHILANIQNHNSIKPVIRVGILESLTMNVGTEIVRRSMPIISEITLLTASANVLMQRLLEPQNLAPAGCITIRSEILGWI